MQGTSLTSDPSTWRVLVVDDKPLNLKLAQAILEPAGAQVMLINEPQQILSMPPEVGFNIILLDLAMPNISGWDIQQEIRRKPEFDHIPIIAFTALAMGGDIARGKEAGFDGYVTKPFHVAQLVAELKRSIESFLARPISNT